LLLADIDGVAGVVATLVARHNIEAIREQIDNFPFTLIAPLGAEDDHVSHLCPNLLVYRQNQPRNRKREKRAESSQIVSGHDTLTFYGHFRRLPWLGPRCVCPSDSRDLNREAEDLSDL